MEKGGAPRAPSRERPRGHHPCSERLRALAPCTVMGQTGPYRAHLSAITVHGREASVPESYTVPAAPPNGGGSVPFVHCPAQEHPQHASSHHGSSDNIRRGRRDPRSLRNRGMCLKFKSHSPVWAVWHPTKLQVRGTANKAPQNRVPKFQTLGPVFEVNGPLVVPTVRDITWGGQE